MQGLKTADPARYAALVKLFPNDSTDVAEAKAAVLASYTDAQLAAFGDQAEAIKVVNDVYAAAFAAANPAYETWLAERRVAEQATVSPTSGVPVSI